MDDFKQLDLNKNKINILLVDDKVGNLIALKATLNHPDYNLVTATSGREALGKIHPDESALRQPANLHRHPGAFSGGARGRQTSSGVSDHARLENVARAEGSLEDSWHRDHALVPARRRSAQSWSAHERFL